MGYGLPQCFGSLGVYNYACPSRFGIQATLRVPEPLKEVSATGGAQVGTGWLGGGMLLERWVGYLEDGLAGLVSGYSSNPYL